MKRVLLFIMVLFAGKFGFSQKIAAIYFNLYTDSLKKGFYNYINVDGKYEDGHWMPLDTNQIELSSNGGRFRGNDLFIDSSYTCETITVKAVVKNNPALWKETTIYIRKRPFTEPLPTNEDIFNENKKSKKKKDK